ncbi:hypothetical protein KZ810_16345 [Sphingomonas sp. RHCKR47]|uniref:hypothetical protein n=1 Tax=Sphingomonas citricola TaxID=2862498 RepID=UPI001CA50C9C|nr:hypothetical protein [Sphingomonas citricola]MBW6525067.1 hypothetical protein [Sphingomonas citricola]
MALSDPIKVRLREGQALVYAAEAEGRGVGVATVIRERLERADKADEELASIRASLIELGDDVERLRRLVADQSVEAPGGAQQEDQPSAVQLEMLLLLRGLVSPQTLRMVTAEVERQGLVPWGRGVR